MRKSLDSVTHTKTEGFLLDFGPNWGISGKVRLQKNPQPNPKPPKTQTKKPKWQK